MLIRDVLWNPIVALPQISEDRDPLRSPAVLHESQVLDVRINALRSTAAILLELRAGFDLLAGNTAAIVMRGAWSVHWTITDDVQDLLTAWAVVGASVQALPGSFELGLGLSPSAEFAGVAKVIEYYGMDAGIGETIPDYLDASEDLVRSAVASWESPVLPIEFSVLSSG